MPSLRNLHIEPELSSLTVCKGSNIDEQAKKPMRTHLNALNPQSPQNPKENSMVRLKEKP